MTKTGRARGDLACALALAATKAAVSGAVLAAGFRHVSDDDYTRTVIAQTFAHAPRLDPSGTSWLPLPFWVTGAAMMALGRSLAVARIVAIVLSSVAAVAPFLGARALGVPRWVALIGALVAACMPPSVWLGAATVPEGYTGLVVAGAVLSIASPSRRAWAWGVAGLAIACLSRYEPWPIALACAAVLAVRAVRGRDGFAGALAAACALGPVAWMVWNAHAHGDALHFFARVSTFRRGFGGGTLGERLLGYPKALALVMPEAIALPVLGVWGLARSAEARRAWGLPLALAAISLCVLIAGDVRDGAPTHHAERALVTVGALFAMAGVHGIAAWPNARPRRNLGAIGAVWALATAVRAGAMPGEEPWEDRTTQLAFGEELRDARGDLEVTPCAYEHFALIAAYGAPERVTIRAADPGALRCPRVRVAPRSE